ncbi:MAG: Nmad5 family putative nucleotide modification protein [Acinetobacter sp.]
MTRLTKTIKTDIKGLIRDKAINPRELALEAKKRDFLLKAFWVQISKYDYQAWKTLPSGMYKTVTHITFHLQLSDRALGQINAYFNKEIPYPHNMSRWMTYDSLPNHLKDEFKELMKEVDAHDAYVAEVMTNLDVTLNSCTTVKKLRELWVNGAAIIDKALGQSQQSPTVFMPMVAIQTLDTLVPLP